MGKSDMQDKIVYHSLILATGLAAKTLTPWTPAEMTFFGHPDERFLQQHIQRQCIVCRGCDQRMERQQVICSTGLDRGGSQLVPFASGV